MEVKGTAIASIPIFVKQKFGEKGLRSWLEALPDNSRKIFSEDIRHKTWFSLRDALINPTLKVSELFYGTDNHQCAWEMGRFSAEYSFKGPLSVLVKIASVKYLIVSASLLLSHFYRDGQIKTINSGENFALIHLKKLPQIHEVVEFRIGGWIQSALEINGCKNVRVDIQNYLSKGDPITEYVCVWEQG